MDIASDPAMSLPPPAFTPFWGVGRGIGSIEPIDPPKQGRADHEAGGDQNCDPCSDKEQQIGCIHAPKVAQDFVNCTLKEG